MTGFAAERDELLRILVAIPPFHRVGADRISIVELHGTTNRNFRIDTPLGRFALRLPSFDGAGFVNRAWETETARLAGQAGIGPVLIYADPETGTMVSEWVDGSPLTASTVRQDSRVVERVAGALAMLHRSGLSFPRHFHAFAIVNRYQRSVSASGQAACPWPAPVTDALDKVRRSLSDARYEEVPSHCDPVPHNFLDTGERIVLVDWEYAGMNDPAWDLAYFALESGLDRPGLETLLEAYDLGALDGGRVRSYQLVAACMGVLWSKLRDPGGQDEAMSEWAAARLLAAESLAGEF